MSNLEKRKPTILVVDDDPNLRKTVADILRNRGYEIVTAESGHAAFAALQIAFPDLALVDLILPDMSGLKVLECIKAASPLTEVIILTGHASMDTAIEATKKSAFSYLLKPYNVEDLLLTVGHGLDRQRAQKEIQALASYPTLDPNAVIELNHAGEVTYINPAAEKLFPDLRQAGRAHPLLDGLPDLFAALRQKGSPDMVREVAIDQATFEQHISYIQHADLVRLYILDITQRKQEETSLETREREQAAVADLGTQALVDLNLSAIFSKAASLICQILEVQYCAILELVPGSCGLLLRAGAGYDAAQYNQLCFEAHTGTCMAFVLAAQEPVILADVAQESRFVIPSLLQQQHVASAIFLRIGSGEPPFGILGVFSARHRTFTNDDQHFLQALANVLSVAVQRKQVDDRIHLLATTDSLTGIANRREFNTLLENELNRAQRHAIPLSLIMYDLDQFKKVNDRFGHDVGDRILQGVTRLVKQNLRSEDVFARWGGEEFMILLPHTDLLAAEMAAEKVRQIIAEYRFPTAGTLTVSFGVTSFEPWDDRNSLLTRVDGALYKAKHNGRNRVEAVTGRDQKPQQNMLSETPL
jgi:diguanylate cyclase (GGDEF)-like protein